jgi:pullulanase
MKMLFALVVIAGIALSCQIRKEKSYEDYPVYNGDDLGLTYDPTYSQFRVWSPTAEKVTIQFYSAGEGGTPAETLDLKKSTGGTWELRVEKDLAGQFYTYQVSVDSLLPETQGIYAKAVGVNGKRAAIINPASTNPEGWFIDTSPAITQPNDIILYEMHVRDFTIGPESGSSSPGKYAGVAEPGTKNSHGNSTGVDHLKELGITHVHLLPVFDHQSIDETKLSEPQYNWGYDPKNFNVPEGSFSSDPYNPSTRIYEFKKMVMGLHANGLRVIMDVVYNHTGETAHSAFNLEVPGYYYRHDGSGRLSNATACGNETASERAMMRKYIIESCKYWITEYHIDGFRFDLMGVHDLSTMNLVAEELLKIDPSLFFYGEGWTAGASPLPDSLRALKANTSKLHHIAAFSDDLRDGIKGSVFEDLSRGFVNGGEGAEESIKFGIVAATQHPQVNYQKVNYSKAPWALDPSQCINYVSCHDNNTLFDKLVLTGEGKESEGDLVKMDKMANAIVLTSQGVPFLHAGEEMLRTKHGEHNSFNKPDAVNQIDWRWKTGHADVFKYYQDLITLRRSHPAFRMKSAEMIRANLKFMEPAEPRVVAYSINGNAAGDTWNEIIVIFNANRKPVTMEIPDGKWNVAVAGEKIELKNPKAVRGGTTTIAELSTWIIYR